MKCKQSSTLFKILRKKKTSFPPMIINDKQYGQTLHCYTFEDSRHRERGFIYSVDSHHHHENIVYRFSRLILFFFYTVFREIIFKRLVSFYTNTYFRSNLIVKTETSLKLIGLFLKLEFRELPKLTAENLK